MKRLLVTALLCGLVLIAGIAQEEIPDLSQVEIITNHVGGNIYRLEATGDVAGNIAASIGPDGILLVDTQFAPLSELILKALRKISDRPIKYIINTHHHIDHTHGNPVLGKSATIIAHANAYKRLMAMPAEGRPAITFQDSASLFFNGEEIKISHYPLGHTDNDVVIFFTKSKVVHLGDLWNSGISSFPTVDLEAGGSIIGMLRNVENLIKIIPKDAKIIPGHYGLSDLKGLRSTRDMLLETINIVSRKKASGKSLKQIQKEGFPPEYDDWGKAYTDAKTWIENIYLGLDQVKTGQRPENFKQIQAEAEKIYLNAKGFWEAELKGGYFMVYIPAGEFKMGSNDGLSGEKPVHKVYLDGYTETSPVGSFPAGASPYGLMDMAGNVWEWCYDVFQDDYYSISPLRNPFGPPDTGKKVQARVNRGGGSWTDRSGHITPEGGHNLRSAARTGDEQNSSDDHMGFRVAIRN